jgi:hypothetical protein
MTLRRLAIQTDFYLLGVIMNSWYDVQMGAKRSQIDAAAAAPCLHKYCTKSCRSGRKGVREEEKFVCTRVYTFDVDVKLKRRRRRDRIKLIWRNNHQSFRARQLSHAEMMFQLIELKPFRRLNMYVYVCTCCVLHISR